MPCEVTRRFAVVVARFSGRQGWIRSPFEREDKGLEILCSDGQGNIRRSARHGVVVRNGATSDHNCGQDEAQDDGDDIGESSSHGGVVGECSSSDHRATEELASQELAGHHSGREYEHVC